MRHPLARVSCKQESKGRGTDARPAPGRTDSKLKTERPGGPLWKAVLPAVICRVAAGAHPEQQIVLSARSGTWYVQPYADQPFTRIRPDGTWSNSTHLGTEYAALLAEECSPVP